MIGILIVAHGTLGESLIHCASHVMGGRPPKLQQLGIGMHDDPVDLLPLGLQMVRDLDEGQGVLVLSDIYGATPCNVVGKLLTPGRVEGVAGVNLPMLVRALTYRNGSITTLVEKALSGGREGVVHFTEEACKHHDQAGN
ncbi:PTS fructose transporter subunit IIA [Pseudomethylobacillus aquaticus]|uniref:PTS fructose transporter subunit IIA n=1 Tax=Pseudomethylobacillus aquaticus TaxID=2676064 RepID=A0A3N0UZF8_9PROT|nr:PTS fructose transporter subunit IIA [Pseudomethylobacillus aquaticus]ROH85825.1 PTS fructose transporter subunit IIA [Pseudomethylobacillus aquaticus]